MANQTKITYIIDEKLATLRIDKALPILNANNTRAYYSHAIKNGKVLVNSKEISPSYKVKEGDVITLIIEDDPLKDELKPYEMDLPVIYEDDDVLIINKPQGLVVHPGNGHADDTLVNALIYNEKQLSTINGLNRIGIVHRIDKDTSGLLLVCKNNNAHNYIAEQLKDHTMHREYLGLVSGVFPHEKGKVIAPLARSKTNRMKYEVNQVNGKEAITNFEVVKRFNNYTLLKFKLETGRTHQIRVHMEYLNHPIVGDPLYGKNNCALYSKGQLLHAYRLTFIHPTTKKEMTFEAPLPNYFKEILDKLN